MRETLVKTEEFKDSPLGKIPKDWNVCRLKDLTDSPDSITYGVLKPGEYIPDGIPLLQIQDVIHGKIEPSKLHRISKGLDAQYARTRLYGGEIVMSLVGTIGKIAQIPDSMAGANLHRNLARIPVARGNSSRFVFHYLQSQTVQEAIAATTFGSTQSLLNLTDLRELLVAVPPPQEQQTIAHIIDTIDSTIAHTSSLIAKLKQMKAGLLHHLLTRGLDENGELRDAIGHPEQFKDSPLGRIPKDWEVATLGEACSLVKDGSHLPPKRVENGPLLLSVQNIINDRLQWTDSDTRISWDFYKSMHRNWEILVGDVLLTIIGTIGRTAIVPPMPPFTLQRNVAVLRGKTSILDNLFLHHYLASNFFQKIVARRGNQTAQPAIFLSDINVLKVPIPILKEQKKIAAIVEDYNTRIRTEEAYRDKLKLQKQGLMHDLLTGKVRVKDADKFTPASDTV